MGRQLSVKGFLGGRMKIHLFAGFHNVHQPLKRHGAGRYKQKGRVGAGPGLNRVCVGYILNK